MEIASSRVGRRATEEFALGDSDDDQIEQADTKMERRLSGQFEHNDLINNRVNDFEQGFTGDVYGIDDSLLDQAESSTSIDLSSTRVRDLEERCQALEDLLKQKEDENSSLRLRIAQLESGNLQASPQGHSALGKLQAALEFPTSTSASSVALAGPHGAPHAALESPTPSASSGAAPSSIERSETWGKVSKTRLLSVGVESLIKMAGAPREVENARFDRRNERRRKIFGRREDAALDQASNADEDESGGGIMDSLTSMMGWTADEPTTAEEPQETHREEEETSRSSAAASRWRAGVSLATAVSNFMGYDTEDENASSRRRVARDKVRRNSEHVEAIYRRAWEPEGSMKRVASSADVRRGSTKHLGKGKGCRVDDSDISVRDDDSNSGAPLSKIVLRVRDSKEPVKQSESCERESEKRNQVASLGSGDPVAGKQGPETSRSEGSGQEAKSQSASSSVSAGTALINPSETSPACPSSSIEDTKTKLTRCAAEIHKGNQAISRLRSQFQDAKLRLKRNVNPTDGFQSGQHTLASSSPLHAPSGATSNCASPRTLGGTYDDTSRADGGVSASADVGRNNAAERASVSTDVTSARETDVVSNAAPGRLALLRASVSTAASLSEEPRADSVTHGAVGGTSGGHSGTTVRDGMSANAAEVTSTGTPVPVVPSPGGAAGTLESTACVASHDRAVASPAAKPPSADVPRTAMSLGTAVKMASAVSRLRAGNTREGLTREGIAAARKFAASRIGGTTPEAPVAEQPQEVKSTPSATPTSAVVSPGNAAEGADVSDGHGVDADTSQALKVGSECVDQAVEPSIPLPITGKQGSTPGLHHTDDAPLRFRAMKSINDELADAIGNPGFLD
eukprot:TRINITY_DN21047_c0_g1_i1.p1 TRINITY_DN21047_c0_g1~~TRINITY_DN21047_c0_g1_i1.p1  ORF type:complete len:857 (-),score=97.81 TRINITY_DN21047_c0_g1_i1:130-2700(-)